MRQNLPVTQKEQVFSNKDNILSTTDPQGKITYVNHDFIKISGFEKDELLGQDHNIVRHPDMPPAAFKSLWETARNGDSWIGIVKNRCKNGDHYFVSAFVTPIFKQGKLTEIQSVRTKPKASQIKRASVLYQQLNKGKTPRKLRDNKFTFTAQLITIQALAGAGSVAAVQAQLGWPAVLAIAASACVATFFTLAPFRRLVNKAKGIRTDNLAKYVYTGRTDCVAQIDFALNYLEAESSSLIGRMSDTATQLNLGSSDLTVAVNETQTGANNQFAMTDQAAAAVEEMSMSVQEVAENALTASNAATDSLSVVNSSKDKLDQNRNSIIKLSDQVSDAANLIENVRKSSQEITSVLDVIRGIAEQTNLLALNAAIEAARAGDAGRGFSVVADEVRSLATRTQHSTEEIQGMIETLQQGTHQAVSSMQSSQSQASDCAKQSEDMVLALDNITGSVTNINDMAGQIAAAVHQQSAVATEISNNLSEIRSLAETNIITSENGATTCKNFNSMSSDMNELAIQFWDKKQGSM
ncbi:MAG: methyl-accepting chemotaxis protein [Pseudomonadales bacterium]